MTAMYEHNRTRANHIQTFKPHLDVATAPSLPFFSVANNMDCKLTEPTQISSLLDIEHLDANLYRSKKVILPPKTRSACIRFDCVLQLTRGSVIGVFGGLVISHAMVAATGTVKPEFHLHVRVITGSERLPAHPPVQSLHVGFIV